MRKKSGLLLGLLCGTLLLTSCSFLPNSDTSGSSSSPTESSSVAVETYTITFRQTGVNDITRKVKAGEALTDIPTPQTKTGYTVAWDRTDFTNIQENITVTAVETPNKYTITYNANDGTVTPTTQEVTYDGEVTLATPTREGYTFVCWKNDGQAVTSGRWTIADNVTLVADWTPNEVVIYTITFVQNGYEPITCKVEKGKSLTNIPTPQEKTGYTVAWNRTDFANIQETFTVKAVETPNKYTITYDANGGTVTPTTQKATYDGEVTLATPMRDGYTFVCWKKGEQTVASRTWTIASDVTLVAEWRKNEVEKCTISFVQDGCPTITCEVKKGGTLADTNIPTPQEKTGYTVTWDTTDFTNIQQSFLVKAVETPNTYKITYNANDGTVTPTTQPATYDGEVTLATPTRDGYTFVCWKNDGETVTSGTWKIADNVTLVAEWRKNEVVKYTITFVQNGCEPIKLEVEKGEDLTDIPTPQEKTGYTIAWDRTDFANIQETFTVKAVEKAKQFTLVFNANGGTATGSITVTYDQAYELAKPTNGDKEFVGWEYNGKSVSQNGIWNIDSESTTITLKASWKEKTNDDEEWTKNY